MMGGRGRPPRAEMQRRRRTHNVCEEEVDTCYIRHAYAARQGLCAVRCVQCARRNSSNRGQRAKSLTVSRTRLAAGALDYGALLLRSYKQCGHLDMWVAGSMADLIE
eukprot:scaffold31447_cov135-Isochrysis_galbana.AAC.2